MCTIRSSPQAALEAGASYFDLTEDIATTRRVRRSPSRPGRARSSCRSAAWRRASSRSSPQHLTEVVRVARHRLHARRRPAAVSHQCAEVQPDLVDRRPDQRILQSVRGDSRRPADERAAAGRRRAFLARRRALRGLQHLRRPGHAVRHARRPGARAELQNHSLPGPSRLDGVPGQRAAAWPSGARCSRTFWKTPSRSRFRTWS